MSKRLSIYKIAELAGVAPSTVSKVINGRPDVGDETRKIIQDIINQQQFKPSLSKAVVDTIGIFLPLHYGAKFSNPYIAGIVSGIVDTAEDLNFNVTIADTKKIPKDLHDFTKFCRSRKISGAIFALLTEQDDYIFNIAGSFPIVTISRDYGREIAGCVMADNFRGGFDALTHLISMNHKNIIMVNPSTRFPDHNYRIKGGKKALTQCGCNGEIIDIENSLDLSDFELGRILDNIFSKEIYPTAIFVASDQEALRFIRLLGDKGIVIPNDISMVGFDDLSFTANITPQLTTVRQPLYEIGRESCSMLVQMVTGDTCEKGIKVLDTELVIRNSVNKL